MLKVNSITITTIAYFLCQFGKADITVAPKDTETKVGEQTFLNCSTNITTRQIKWNHGTKYVYAGGSLLEPYSNRSEIDENATIGFCNFVIPSVVAEDAGEYSCVDDGGLGTLVIAQLIVLTNDPVCESNLNLSEVIGPNSCRIEPDELRLSCKTQYSGGHPPKMVWRKSEEETPIKEGIETVNSSSGVIYHLKMDANISMDGQSYVCETTRSVANQYKCNSGVARILYAFSNETVVNRTTDDEIICSANSNALCNYTWMSIKDDNEKVVSKEETFKPENPGRYQCEAKCLMKTNSCSFVAMVVEVSSIPQNAGKLWLVVLVLLMIVVIAVIIFFIVKTQKQRKNKQTDSNERDTVASTLLPTPASDSVEEVPHTAIEMAQTHGREDDTSKKIQKHMPFLVERMDSDSGLLDILLEKRAFSRRRMFEIKSSLSEQGRNENLLRHMLGNNSSILLDALEGNGQSHLYNYLKADGKHRSEFGNKWPLSEREIDILDTNHRILVDQIDSKDLLHELLAVNVINRRQLEFIDSKQTSSEKNESLLNILRKRSLEDFRNTLVVLHASNQSHIAKILEGGGGDN